MKRKDFTSQRRSALGSSSRDTGQEGSGYRSRRLATDRRARQRRWAKLILGAGIVLAALVFLGVLAFVRIREPGGEAQPEQPVADSGSGNVIMMGRDDAGKLSHVLLLARDSGGGFSLYLIPAHTVADVAGQGFQQLDRAYEESGQQALDQAVADLLQMPVQYHVFFDNQATALVTEQAGVVNFKTGVPLVINAGLSGGPETIAPGDNPTGSSMALGLFKAAEADNRDGPRVLSAFYQGVHDALAAKPEVDRRALSRQLLGRIKTDMDEGEFLDLIVAATAPGRGFGVWPLPVKTVISGSEWYFEPSMPELELLLAGSAQDGAYQLEIQNGTEAQGVAEPVAARLQTLRYSVSMKPEPSGVNFDVTQIRCGTDALEAGNRVRDLLGLGTIIKDEYLEKKQIIVIIGRDLLPAN